MVPDSHQNGAGSRSTSAVGRLVRDRLEGDPAWRHLTADGRWICPYCLTAIRSPQPGKANLARAIERHLANRCPDFQAGQGGYRDEDAIRQRLRFEDISTAATTDPAWQVFDHEGYWYSPFSLQRVPEVHAPKGQLDGALLRGMAEHLMRCPAYQQGTIHPVNEVQAARDRAVLVSRIRVEVVDKHLNSPHWRYHDPVGAWVCPFCLTRLTQVNLGQPDHAGRVASHLIECPGFRQQPARLQSESRVREASCGGTPMPPIPAKGIATARSRSLSRANQVLPPNGTPQAVKLERQQWDMTPPSGNLVAGSTKTPPVAAPVPPPEQAPFNVDGAQALTGSLLDRLAGEDPPLASSEQSWLFGVDDDPQSAKSKSHSQEIDLERARDVQAGLLPQAPQLPGYRFATRYEPCSTVSGDFYEFIALADGRLGFAMGDVSGHGIQAALVMSMTKKTLAIYACDGDPPAQVLTAVNSAIAGDLNGRNFVTMTYAILDPAARTVTWARAGHDPAIWVNFPSRTCRDIMPPGMVVGMKTGELFANLLKEEVTPLQSGDLILLFTDGVTETMNRQGEEYGRDRLQEVLLQHGSGDLGTLLDRILDSIRTFRGRTQAKDDITILALAVD